MQAKTLLFIFSVVIFTSCATAYKSGQTPDDLYYAKGKVVVDASEKYRQETSYENTQIRMAARDYRWRSLDNNYEFDYTYSPYNYGYNYGYYYNPCYYPYPVYSAGVKSVNPKNTTIRTTNLNTYNNTISTYTPTKSNGNVRITTVRGYNYDNTGNTRSVSNDNRSYAPATNNNSSTNSGTNSNNSGSSNSSSGTSVSRPGRGN